MNYLTRGIVRAVKKRARHILKKYFIYIAKHPDNAQAFALFGGFESLARYSRLYLGVNGTAQLSKRPAIKWRLSIKRLLNTYGMVLAQNLPPKLAHEALTVPDFINLSITLPTDIDAFYSKLPNAARYDVRKIKQGGFYSVISTDATWIPNFYNDYYLPTMQKRHGEEAYIISESKMQALMATGNYELLKIFEGDNCVAVVLAKIETHSYHYFKVGWFKGDDSLIKIGATAAMYWFVIQRAFELKRQQVVLGGTPAYLENGVLKYKAKWLAGFTATTYGVNYLLLNPDIPDCYNFLKQYSLIALNKNNQPIVISAKTRDNAGVTGSILNDITDWYQLRETKADKPGNDVADLPKSLRQWYQSGLITR